MIELDRRQFLRTAGAGFAASLMPWQSELLAAGRPLYAANAMDPQGRHFVLLVDGSGAIADRYELPARGHDAVASQDGSRLAVFARRPGTFAIGFDGDRLRSPKLFSSPAGRHFYGHGVYSGDGKLLYTTENDYEGERGIIGVHDATDGYARIGEFPSHGIGPHELLLTGDGGTLVIANGGILTHPDFGRAKLNLAQMQPSIAFVDAANGNLLEKHELPAEYSRLSTRHMAIDRAGGLWVGCQYQGDAGTRVPLVAKLRRGEPLEFAGLPEPDLTSLGGYVGSVAADATGETIAFTSPRGGVMLIVDAASGKLAGKRQLPRVCGVAAGAGSGFVLSSELGRFAAADHKLAWDNHITPIT